MDELELPQAETREDDSYKDLASLLLGSLHVSFGCQTYNLQDRIASDNKRLVGEGGKGGEFPEEAVKFSSKEMKGKPLGDIRNVLFYTKEQKQLIDSLNRLLHKEANVQEELIDTSSPTPTVIIGDYGTGKSVILDSTATKFEANRKKVHYLSALGWFIFVVILRQYYFHKITRQRRPRTY